METLKTYLIVGLAILCFVLAIMYDKKPTSSTTVTNSASTSTTLSTINGSAVITGVTSATTLPNGSVAVSGTNMSIKTDTHLESQNLTNSSNSSKNTFKYSYNTIGIGGIISSDIFSSLNYGATIIYTNPDVSIYAGYIITRREYLLGFNKTIIGW